MNELILKQIDKIEAGKGDAYQSGDDIELALEEIKRLIGNQKFITKMKRVTIESDNRDIQVECPNCDMWEQLGVDDPRKMLNALPIIDWLTMPAESNEVSVNECSECETKFEVEWDYNNPLI